MQLAVLIPDHGFCMQHTLGLQTPPTTFLGVSPPRRQSGAANPLKQVKFDLLR